MKPIIMSTEDVRGILDGRKTMARLVAKELDGVDILNCRHVDGDIQEPKGYPIGHVSLTERCKFKPGDVLYVRETWCELAMVDADGYTHYDDCKYFYATDGDYQIDLYDDNGFYLDDQKMKWRSPVTMPREAARLFLRVTDVRVERVQNISEKDAVAEGLSSVTVTLGKMMDTMSASYQYQKMWDARNAKRGYGWDSNPWVWVIEFERITQEEADE